METYKITKTIRFKLEADEKNIPNIKEDVKSIEIKDGEFNLTVFISGLNNYLDNLNGYLFYKNQKGEFSVKEKMTIKNEWLRQYAKQEFAELKVKKQNNTENKRREQIKIGDIPKLTDKIKKASNEVYEIYEKLCDDAGLELNERARRAQTGLLLKRLAAKNALSFLIDLVDNTSDKNETTDLSVRIRKQSQKIRSLLQIAIQKFLPEQSGGLQIAKASFNYHTINKKPVDFKEKIIELEEKLTIRNLSEINQYFDRKIHKNKLY